MPVFADDQYELLDFGNGIKLENFNGVTVERPCPAAKSARRSTAASETSRTLVRFDRQSEIWSGESVPDAWTIKFGSSFALELKPSPFGHLGVFPEQAANWQWLMETANSINPDNEELNAINLFAYTGGSTLALSSAGVRVTHVDAASNICRRAKRNAALSGLDNRPIRWIAEDVMTFLKREVKRGRRYDIVVADPPSFGRGPKKQQWKLNRDLPELLELAVELTEGSPAAILISCHTGGFEAPVLQKMVSQTFGLPRRQIKAAPMVLRTSSGRTLNAGHCVRWSKDTS
ncbi:MAG: class I SAM-dependent methyltransferase [Planctomycetota bacterium]